MEVQRFYSFYTQQVGAQSKGPFHFDGRYMWHIALSHVCLNSSSIMTSSTEFNGRQSEQSDHQKTIFCDINTF